MTPARESAEARIVRLQHKAEVLRARFLRTVDVLDQRRREMKRIGERARSLLVPVAVSLVGIGLLLGASAFALYHAAKARRTRLLPPRVSRTIDGLRRVRPPSFARRLLERVALACVSLLATQVAKRGSRSVLLEARRPGPA